MEKKTKGANLAAPHGDGEIQFNPKTHGREIFEREANCKLIKWEDLLNHPWHSDFAHKIKKLARYGNVDSVMLISKPAKSIEDWITVNFFTNDNTYSIHVHWKDSMANSYLGCTVSSRKPRPGEKWTRGNDLPDGTYHEDTWNEILRAIIAYEMKTLQI